MFVESCDKGQVAAFDGWRPDVLVERRSADVPSGKASGALPTEATQSLARLFYVTARLTAAPAGSG